MKNITYTFSLEEVRILTQIMNEVCHGLHIYNFEAEMSVDIKSAKKFLSKIDFIYMKNDREACKSIELIVIEKENKIFENAMRLIERYFDESDFGNRLGCSKEEFIHFKNRFTQKPEFG
jgi:hypothetical protein